MFVFAIVCLTEGDRVVSVNGETVRTHHQASGLIKSSPPLVSLLVEKLTADQRPLASTCSMLYVIVISCLGVLQHT